MKIQTLRHLGENFFNASSQRCSLFRNTSETLVLHSMVRQRRISQVFARMGTILNYEVARHMVLVNTLPPLQTYH